MPPSPHPFLQAGSQACILVACATNSVVFHVLLVATLFFPTKRKLLICKEDGASPPGAHVYNMIMR